MSNQDGAPTDIFLLEISVDSDATLLGVKYIDIDQVDINVNPGF